MTAEFDQSHNVSLMSETLALSLTRPSSWNYPGTFEIRFFGHSAGAHDRHLCLMFLALWWRLLVRL